MRLRVTAWFAILVGASAGPGCATGAPAPTPGAPRTPPTVAAAPVALPTAPADPPAVLTGEGELRCTIDSRSNGRQTLRILAGGGLEFDAVVSPIVDGTVKTNGPDQGGEYRFTSHLASPAKGRLPGAGDVELDALETKVAVEMSRYKQPGGRGTKLTFSSGDMSKRGIYIEFAGKAHSARGDRYAFRVNLGAPVEGSGEVQPADDNANSRMMSKAVYVRAPVSTVLVTTTVERLP